MRNILLLLLAISSLNCANDSMPAQAQDASADVIAFTNVSVLPMDSERVLENHTVLVRGERIVEMGPTGDVVIPGGATQIDGRGKFLMPGLAEMHGHIPPPTDPQAYTDAVLYMYVANGITTVRGMLGHDGQLDIRRKANAGDIIAPTVADQNRAGPVMARHAGAVGHRIAVEGQRLAQKKVRHRVSPKSSLRHSVRPCSARAIGPLPLFL